MSDKPIQELVTAPVVSADATSPEAIMARDAKKLQVQANTDGQFDTKLERFCGGTTTQTLTLSSLALILSLFLAAHLARHRR